VIAQSTIHILDRMRRAYNFDNSDPMVDYFHVRYYGDASFAWKLEKADREAVKARVVAA
jgi:hypothetical protein